MPLMGTSHEGFGQEEHWTCLVYTDTYAGGVV